MASHDFCPGCDECDRDYRNSKRSTEIDRIRTAINELRNLPASDHTDYTTHVISELERKIEKIKGEYEYKKR